MASVGLRRSLWPLRPPPTRLRNVIRRALPGSIGSTRRVALLLLPLLSACGGANNQLKSPQAPSEAASPEASPSQQSQSFEQEAATESPESVEDAVALQRRAEADLERLVPLDGGLDAVELSTKKLSASCSNACRALESLRRAAGAICELTHPGDERCLDAQASLERNRERVSACECGSDAP